MRLTFCFQAPCIKSLILTYLLSNLLSLYSENNVPIVVYVFCRIYITIQEYQLM